MYKAGDKFIIEIEEVFTGKVTGYPQYRIKGFDKLIMDDRGLVKLSKYEDKQKQDAEIKVGDEIVYRDGIKGIVVGISNTIGQISVLNNKYDVPQLLVKNGAKKTGRTFPQIAEVLAELRGAENDE